MLKDVYAHAMSRLNACLTPRVLQHVPPPIHLLPWAYPSVDCRPDFIDSGAPGRGCAVTPSMLRPIQITKIYHEHHVYVIMHVIECVDKFLVT